MDRARRHSILTIALIMALAPPVALAAPDADGDGVDDAVDNCPAAPNADQANADAATDGGDACDADDDNDLVNDVGTLGQVLDNCRVARNANQNDGDADGTGDACDADIDGDGVPNTSDADADGDGASNDAEGAAGTDAHNRRSSPATPSDETRPGCEPTQPWIGYGRTHELHAAYRSLDPQERVNTCEGEHWDGQDNVQPGHRPPAGGPACPAAEAPEGGIAASNCMQPNPNFGESTLLGFRVTTKGTDAYFAITIGVLGRASFSESTTQEKATAGLYLRDNTEGDLLATAVSSTRITRGFVRNGDCTQAQYEAGAYGESPSCGRDNTALTIEALLP